MVEAPDTSVSSRSDWRDPRSYDHIGGLMRQSLAWEFLRRNPDYRDAWSRQDPGPAGELAVEGALRVLQLPELPQHVAKWGLLYLEDPNKDAAEADLVWHPAVCPSVLPANVVPPSADRSSDCVHLASLPTSATLFLGGDDEQHLLIGRPGHAVQLLCPERPRISSDAIIRPEIHGCQALEPKFAALKSLAELRRRAHPTMRVRLPRYVRMLPQILGALDGSLAGASQRDIAARIFGPSTVEQEWRTDSDYLRARVRRLIRKGQELMTSGYRRLLKH